jgi:diguanylate cyclase (GGDEF)-like protein
VPISRPSSAAGGQPATPDELRAWIATELRAPTWQKDQLLASFTDVVDRERRLGLDAKLDAITALSTGFTERVATLQRELAARDETLSSLVEYFEDVVARLADKARRDPKTKLLNFNWFMEQVESFLAVEQRGRWCAMGIVDIADFKWFNDHLGHATGDRIIQRVALLLSEQLRSGDLLAQDASPARELHARFGGDEFCFLIPELPGSHEALTIAGRFKTRVEAFDWSLEHARLVDRPVRVDVGVVCLRLGPLRERRGIARSLANEMIHRADELMYEAKQRAAAGVSSMWARVAEGRLTPMPEPGSARTLRAVSE